MLYFIITILCLLFIIEIINMKESFDIYLFDESYNKILDVDNNPIKSLKIFPNIEGKENNELISMFTNISYCDNLDDLSYNNQYILQDGLFRDGRYIEGFSENPIEKPYLFILGILFIYLLNKFIL